MKDIDYDIKLNPQPTDTTCGPTCLHGIYDHYDMGIKHSEVIRRIRYTKGGGTLGVNLANHALKNNFNAKIITHNLNVFDPTWFSLPKDQMIIKLFKQSRKKRNHKIIESSERYLEFLSLGGEIAYEELSPINLYKLLEQHGPVICGLSATYLYWSKRERNKPIVYDDVKGYPQGHFVILSGMKGDLSVVEVTDPLKNNPLKKGQQYQMSTQHFINSILIGVITYDANIIILSKKD